MKINAIGNFNPIKTFNSNKINTYSNANINSSVLAQDVFFKGKSDNDEDLFPKSVLDEIKKADDAFIKGLSDNPNIKNAYKLYSAWYKAVYEKHLQDSDDKADMRREWEKSVDRRIYFSLLTSDAKNANADVATIESYIARSGELFRINNLLAKPDCNGVKEIFELALDQAGGGERKINIQGTELLEKYSAKAVVQAKGKNAFYQIFSNIIKNAVKYSPKDSEINIEFRKENTKYEYLNGQTAEIPHLYFIVEDKGIGIPKNEQKAVLMGKRASNAASIKGSGYGLCHTKVLLEKEIVIESPLYPDEPIFKGTRVKVQMPDF